MNPFDHAIEFVMAAEGTYVNNILDPGGETKYGISKRQFPDLDIKTITRQDAIGIYREKYWNTCKCDQLPSPLAMVLFDSAVNQGPSIAIRLFQKSVGVTADGVMGPETIAAAFTVDMRKTVAEMVARRAFAYAQLPTLTTFGLGWFRRLAECHQKALEPL